MKRRKLLIPALLLALTLLCACGVTYDGDGKPLFGQNTFYTRTASDEEAFHTLKTQEDEEIILEDDEVPLSGLPIEAEVTEEGWLLVRYVKTADGEVTPQWYRVWTEEGRWSEESLPCGDTGWHPEIPEVPVEPEVEVNPLG